MKGIQSKTGRQEGIKRSMGPTSVNLCASCPLLAEGAVCFKQLGWKGSPCPGLLRIIVSASGGASADNMGKEKHEMQESSLCNNERASALGEKLGWKLRAKVYLYKGTTSRGAQSTLAKAGPQIEIHSFLVENRLHAA